jgi:peptide/nickel transport system permease protein
VVLGALHDGVTVWEQAKELPGYLSDTFLHQRLGHSAPFQKSLRDVVLDGLPVDVALLVGGTVLGVAIGLATGLVSGGRRRSPADRALSIGTALAMSAPVYWFGFIVLTLFAPQSGSLVQIPFVSWYGGYVPFGEDPLRWRQSLWVPWLVLAAPLAAMCHRMTRASVAEVLDEDFIRTARAKGLPERTVIFKHALRAALTPIVTIFGMDLGFALGGVVLAEQVFNLNGIGRSAVDAVNQSDLPVIMGVTIVASAFIVLANLVVDLMYAVVDPRVRIS